MGAEWVDREIATEDPLLMMYTYIYTYIYTL